MSNKWQNAEKKKYQFLRYPGIVIDKSYLHQFSPEDAKVIDGRYLVLMTETLLYELAKDEEERARLFGNIEKLSANFSVVEHYHVYIEFEKRHIKKSPPPSHFLKRRDYGKMNLMRSGVFDNLELIVSERWSLIDATAEVTIGLARILRDKYPKAFGGNDKEKRAELQSLKERVVDDTEFIRSYILGMNLQKSGQDAAALERFSLKVKKGWVHFLVTQVTLLVAIDIASRHRLIEPIHQTVRESIRHDILDSQLLIAGCLVGRIATRDKRIRSWWKLLMKKDVDFGFSAE